MGTDTLTLFVKHINEFFVCANIKTIYICNHGWQASTYPEYSVLQFCFLDVLAVEGSGALGKAHQLVRVLTDPDSEDQA